MGGKSIEEVEVDDLVGAGLGVLEAKEMCREIIKEAAAIRFGGGGKEVWARITARKLLKPWHPHSLHQLIYYSVYFHHDDLTHGPPLYWFPSL